GKPPEWWEKQKGSRGIRRGQWYRLVFQFPIRELLTLTLPQGWLTQHPLGKEIIAQESQWQSYVHWPLEVH
ncbi:hypothetical protein ACRWHL_24090, partial [Escherichia coli]